MTDEQYEATLPRVGHGPHECRVVLLFWDEDGYDDFEVLRARLPDPPRRGSRFDHRGRTWQLDSHEKGEWIAHEVWP